MSRSLCLLAALLLSVAALVSGQTCTVQPACSTTPATVPVAWYNVTFATQVSTATTYGWEPTDAGDAGCYTHRGIATFTGSSSQFVDLNYNTGVNTSGVKIPGTIGGAGSGQLSDGTMGWSFEWTFKSGAEAANGKIFAIGAGAAVWDIFAGPDGNAVGANFGVYGGAGNYNNGQSGILEFVSPTSTATWYHVVAVVQQLLPSASNPTHGAYFIYVNGQLLNYTWVATGVYVNSLLIQAQARPYAYLGKSDWADPYWTGLIDTFRIYDRALTASQVTTLYQGEMGGCSVPTQATTSPISGLVSYPNILPRTATGTVSPIYSLPFANNPCAASTTCLYGWEPTSPTDSGAAASLHTGILILNGQQWVDMAATSGPNALSTTANQPFPTIGGVPSTTNPGWSFELVIKPTSIASWGKIFDIGSTRSNLGTCNNDIVLGWDAGNAQWQFDLCDTAGNQYQTGDAFGNIALGQWYHMVAVIVPVTPSSPSTTFANYFTYINGVLYTAEANFLYPQYVTRQNAWLGRSGWYANGDANFTAELDTFNIYNVALSDTQVAALATAALGSSGTCTAAITCPTSNVATVPTAWYNLTFSTNPGATGYGWENTDASDAGCPFVHQGIVTFNGGASTSNGQYIDLTASTGANAVGSNTLTRTIGGPGSGSLSDGTMGWSFEWTFKSGAEAVNGKQWAIGAGQAVWNIFAGPDGSATGANFGVYDGASSYNNGHSGIVEFINPISTSQWYHVVAVVQQISNNNATHGAYFIYVNGQLLNYAGVGIYVNSLLIQAQPRPNAYIARSDWSADPFWTGIMDTFRIYDRALTQTQVTTLYNGEMGGCYVPTQSTTISNVVSAPNILPRPTSNTAYPNAVYSLTFDTNPCTSGTCTYGWERTSSSDATANQNVHQGILTLNGAQQWVDLMATSGPTSVSSTAFPTIGGVPSTTNPGWSFELVIKPGPVANWGKVMDIGSTRPVLGNCVNDIVLGWDANNAQWQFDVCDGNNNQYQTGDAFGTIYVGQWYHLVAVVTPTANGQANYLTYVNGQLFTAEANFLYPANTARQNAWLGRSGWYVNGDLNFTGEIDSFAVYNVALTDVQIATKAAGIIVTPTSCTSVPQCSSNPTTVPTAWYNVTFATNPVASVSTPTYTWASTVSTDATCAFQHKGLATFAGGPSSGGQFVDLNYATGANSSGVKIPGPIGGPGSGSLSDGTQGWSFEFTFLSGQEAVNGKIFAIGAGQAVWNIFAGPDGSGTGSNFGVYDGQGNYNNGQSGIVEFANPVSTSQWYHVVAVVQQITSNTNMLHGAYFLYVNGQLLNYTGVGIYLNSLSIQAQARPNAYLAKSDWSADPYWTGAIDTFRIYDRALTQQQVTTLYQGEMGGCFVPTSTSVSGQNTLPNLTPRTSNALVTPFWSQTFNTDPRTTTANYNYGWEPVSSTDSTTTQTLRKGILTLNGQQWVDLGASSGPLSVGTNTLPQIGGSNAGWAFELIVKPGSMQNWAKIFDIGSSRSNLGNCVNDITLGWDANNAQWQFDVCDGNNNQYQTGDAFGNINNATWYHMLAVIAPTLNGNGLANYFTYINGQLYTTEANFLYPANTARQNAWLGRSGWYVNGDLNFTGEIDLFNIYNTAVSDQQALNLYNQNFLGQTVSWSASNSGGSSNSSNLSGGAIAGIVIGSVVGALLLLVLCWCFFTGMGRSGGKKTGSNTGYDSHNDQSQIRSEQHHEGEEHTGDGVEMA